MTASSQVSKHLPVSDGWFFFGVPREVQSWTDSKYDLSAQFQTLSVHFVMDINVCDTSCGLRFQNKSMYICWLNLFICLYCEKFAGAKNEQHHTVYWYLLEYKWTIFTQYCSYTRNLRKAVVILKVNVNNFRWRFVAHHLLPILKLW